MIEVIEKKDAIQEAEVQLAQFLRRKGRGLEAKVGFQGGDMDLEVYWLDRLNFWGTFYQADTRYWNAFGLQHPEENHHLDITVEINPPYQGIDRRMGGAFGRNPSHPEEVYLMHRGKVGGGRPGIGKSAFLDFLRQNGPTLREVRDGDQTNPMVVMGPIGEVGFVDELQEFLVSVDEFKEQVQG